MFLCCLRRDKEIPVLSLRRYVLVPNVLITIASGFCTGDGGSWCNGAPTCRLSTPPENSILVPCLSHLAQNAAEEATGTDGVSAEPSWNPSVVIPQRQEGQIMVRLDATPQRCHLIKDGWTEPKHTRDNCRSLLRFIWCKCTSLGNQDPVLHPCLLSGWMMSRLETQSCFLPPPVHGCAPASRSPCSAFGVGTEDGH